MASATAPAARRTLQDQLDRMDSMLDGLSEALQGAVTTAVEKGVQTAVKEGIHAAIVELATNSHILAALTPTLMTAAPTVPPEVAVEATGQATAPTEIALPWLVALRAGVKPTLESIHQLGERGRVLWRSIRSGLHWGWAHRTQLLLLVVSLWAASAVCI